MIEFLLLCDFQSAFGFIAFFSGIISFIAFTAVDSEQYKEHNKAIIRFAKFFLVLMLISLFLVAALPSQEAMSHLLISKWDR